MDRTRATRAPQEYIRARSLARMHVRTCVGAFTYFCFPTSLLSLAQRITVFISYRVDPDQPIVEALYDKLTALKLRVWWDVKCLQPGQLWEDGFIDGLAGSAVFIPLLSKGGLASYSRLVRRHGTRCWKATR